MKTLQRVLTDDDPAFDKLLSDNRERYIQQSALTKCGQVAELPKRIATILPLKRAVK